MKLKLAKTLSLLALAAVGLAAGAASAHGPGYRHHYHGHGPRVHFGVVVGAPVWYPRPYYYPPYAYYPYYPPVVTAPASPPVYIERGDAAPSQAQPQDYWYYCPESKTYYPYVKECPGGWEKVAPRPQG